MIFYKIINKYAKGLLKNSINLVFISWYLNSIYNYEKSARLEHLPVSFPELDLDLHLQSFSSHL